MRKNGLFVMYATSQVISKFLIIVFIFFFSRAAGREGISLYSFSYIPFSLFFDLSSIGIIPGTSKVVSEIEANEGDSKDLLKNSTLRMIIRGVFSFILFQCLATTIIKYSVPKDFTNEKISTIIIALRISGFTLLFNPLLCLYRGYLQGKIRLFTVSLVIILEQSIRVFIVLFFALNNMTSKEIDSSFIVYCVLASTFISNAICTLILYLVIRFDLKSSTNKKSIYNKILRKSIPFGVTTLFYTIYQAIDAFSLGSLLKATNGISVEEIYTTYLYENMRLIFFPIVVAQAYAGIIMPKITRLYSDNKIDKLKLEAENGIFAATHFLIAISFIYIISANYIYDFFYIKNDFGASILKSIVIFIPLFGIYKILLGIVQGIDKISFITAATIISSLAKLIMNYILVPKLGYLGSVYSTIISILICLFSTFVILKKGGIRLFSFFIKNLISSLIICTVTYSILFIIRFTFYIRMNTATQILVGLMVYGIIFTIVYLLIGKFLKLIPKKIGEKESKNIDI